MIMRIELGTDRCYHVEAWRWWWLPFWYRLPGQPNGGFLTKLDACEWMWKLPPAGSA